MKRKFIENQLIILLLSMSNKELQSTTLLTSIPNVTQREDQNLDSVTLRALRHRNKQMDQAIQVVQSRINYMKQKEEKTVKKVINVKRKLTSIQSIRNKARQLYIIIQQQKKNREDLEKKSEYNKLIKDHLKFNKKIVMTLMSHKVHEQAKNLREKKQQIKVLNSVQKDNMAEDNTQKANKVRFDHIEAHEKRKMYFLDKLRQFKNFKQQRLKEQIKQRQRQESMIQQLQDKQRVLLQRLSNSQKFRMKCQQEYEQARKKYRSFYEASRGYSRESSVDENKADIFIS